MHRWNRSSFAALVIVPALGLSVGLAGCSLFKRSDDSDQAPAGAATAAAAATGRAYSMSKEADGDHDLKITRVAVEPARTVVDMTMFGGGKDSFVIHIAPPGAPTALFLETADGKKIPLVGSEGIAVDPQEDSIEPGQTRSFSLFFGPLEPGVRSFHIFEGEAAKDPTLKKKEELWAFRDVELE